MSLSDYICYEIAGIKMCPPILNIKQVKQFIKELKEKLENITGVPKELSSWCKAIDELAGKELI